MEASTPAWLNTLTILGAVLVLGGGGFIGYRIVNLRQTYRDLRPERPASDDKASGNAVIMLVSVLVLAIGLLLLGLGIAGAVRPDQIG